MKNRIIILLWLLMGLPLITYAAQTKITAIHFIEMEQSTRVTFTLSEPTKPTIFSLSNPSRLVLDFKNTRLLVNLKKLPISHRTVTAIREGYPKTSILRIVLDINESTRYKNLSKLGSKQVVLDIFPKKLPQKKANASILKPAITITKIEKNDISTSKYRPITIVIDPGHGGKDPGAIGEQGTQEKDIVLAIANNLANLINQQPNMHAVLTRKGDYYVTLKDRLMVARRVKADLFIAIHADSYFNTQASGASVYSLSQHGATSVAARWLAKRDTYAELGNVDLGLLEDQSYLLRSVLIDLAQTATTKASLRWGASLLDALDDVTRLHYSRVGQAPFMVLKSPDIPSILVETGFISNTKEEVRLRDKKHQNKIALALYNGIRSYQQKYLPSGA